MQFPRQEYWSGLPFPSPGVLPNPGIKPKSPASPALAGRFFATEPAGKPMMIDLCSRYIVSDSLRPHRLQHARLPYPSLSARACPNIMSIESVMLYNHLILCHPLLLLSLIFPSIRVSSNELVLCIRWPKYYSFSISPFNECSMNTQD